ncbi:MAG TPA: DNA polymerase III subunit beta, partial [Pirellulales bacterium]|nr:DNA polymerase III subunit beta [Pirellulales bacterium]
MKLICDRDQLLSAFQTAAAVAPLRSPKPVLQNVKIEATKESVVLLATDLEVGIRIKVAGIEVEAPGSALLPIGRVGLILRESSGDTKLMIDTTPQGTVIKGERSEFRLPAENADEFPSVAAFTDGKYHEVAARLFRELIRRTIFATDNESSRYALGGVLLEMVEKRITAVGTDGRRLAKMEGPAQSVGGHQNADMMTIVPARAMQLMERAFSDADEQVQIAA